MNLLEEIAREIRRLEGAVSQYRYDEKKWLFGNLNGKK